MAESPILAIPQIEENQDNKHITANTAIALLEAAEEDQYVNAAVGAGADTLSEAEASQYILYKLSGLTGNQNLVFPDTINGQNVKRKFIVWNADATDTLTVKGTAAGTTVAVPPGGVVWIAQTTADMKALTPLYTGTTPYDIGVFLPGQPDDGATVWAFKATRAFTMADDFAGSVYDNASNPASTAVFNVNLNGSGIGTISVNTSGVATFSTTGGAVSIAVGDVLELIAPSPQDGTLSDIAITFLGSRSS